MSFAKYYSCSYTAAGTAHSHGWCWFALAPPRSQEGMAWVKRHIAAGSSTDVHGAPYSSDFITFVVSSNLEPSQSESAPKGGRPGQLGITTTDTEEAPCSMLPSCRGATVLSVRPRPRQPEQRGGAAWCGFSWKPTPHGQFPAGWSRPATGEEWFWKGRGANTVR